MERWIRNILVLTLFGFLLSGCLESSSDSEGSSSDEVRELHSVIDSDSSVLSKFFAQSRHSNDWVFTDLPSRFFNSRERIFLTLFFKDTQSVDLRSLKLGFNGFRARHRLDFDLSEDAVWRKKSNGVLILKVELTNLLFREGIPFHQFAKRILMRGRDLTLRVNPSKGLFKAKLSIEKVKVDHLGEKSVVKSLTKKFNFKSKKKTSGIEISNVEPSEFPTMSKTLTVYFDKIVGANGNSKDKNDKKSKENKLEKDSKIKAFCQLDSSEFELCTSPWVLTNLEEGSHQITIRSKKNSSEGEDSFSWEINRTVPLIAWELLPQELTSDSSAEFGFKSNVGAGFECRLDGSSFAACESPYLVTNLEDGNHEFEVRATNGVGVYSQPLHYIWKVDTTAPVVAITEVRPQEAVTNQTDFSLAFSVSETADVECRFDGGLLSTCESPLSLQGLTDGSHELSVIAQDLAGNRSEPVSYEWTVDTKAPAAHAIRLVSPATVPTASDTAVFDLSADDSSTLYCSLDGVKIASCPSPLSLNGLSEGNHRLALWASDTAGNLSETVFFDWEIDWTAPTVTLQQVNPDSLVTDDPTLELSFNVSENAQSYCELDSSGAAPCDSPFYASELAEGLHNLLIWAVDPSGNTSEVLSYEWEVRVEANVIIAGYSPREPITDQAWIDVSFTSENATSFLCAIDGSIPSPCESPFTMDNLNDGDHFFEVWGVNASGYPGVSQTYSWRVDRTPPVVSLGAITPSHSPTSSTSIQIAFSANESASFTCALDGAVAEPCLSPYSAAGLSAGAHLVQIQARDAFGHTSNTVTYSWQVDLTPLIISNVTVTQITKTSAVVSWSTTRLSPSMLNYGVSPSTNNVINLSNSSLSHSVTLTNLNAFNLYAVQVKAMDLDGASTSSSIYSFRTSR